MSHADRQEFSVLGEAINVTSRRKAMAMAHTGIRLVSNTVLKLAGEPASRWRRCTDEPLRGRQVPIAIDAEREDRDPR